MPTLFRNVAIVEAGDPAIVDELIAAGFARYVVHRLGPSAIVVDHERLSEIRTWLKRLGHTPRVVAE